MKTLRVTPAFALDLRLSPLAVRTFLVLLNCRDGKTGLSAITVEHVAERVGRSKKNALHAVQELERCGYIRNLEPERKAARYEFLSGVENDTREKPVDHPATPKTDEPPSPEDRAAAERVIAKMAQRWGRSARANDRGAAMDAQVDKLVKRPA
jgi:predicted transcriptional regulator